MNDNLILLSGIESCVDTLKTKHYILALQYRFFDNKPIQFECIAGIKENETVKKSFRAVLSFYWVWVCQAWGNNIIITYIMQVSYWTCRTGCPKMGGYFSAHQRYMKDAKFPTRAGTPRAVVQKQHQNDSKSKPNVECRHPQLLPPLYLATTLTYLHLNKGIRLSQWASVCILTAAKDIFVSLFAPSEKTSNRKLDCVLSSGGQTSYKV